MLRRSISVDEVVEVANNGGIIAEYVDDKPCPSYLLLGYVKERTLRVVVTKEDETAKCIVVTCYEPDRAIWNVTLTKKNK